MTRAAEGVQQGGGSLEVSETDVQHCDWCGAGSLTMLNRGKCLLVYYCSMQLDQEHGAAGAGAHVSCLPVAPGLSSAQVFNISASLLFG
jgi:hypothetical protein